MTDLFSDPETWAWAQRAVDELVPMIRQSAETISLVPETAGLDDELTTGDPE